MQDIRIVPIIMFVWIRRILGVFEGVRGELWSFDKKMCAKNWHLLGPDVLCGCEGHQTERRPENGRQHSSEMGLTACKLISLFLSLLP